jgi:hypothetical protein
MNWVRRHVRSICGVGIACFAVLASLIFIMPAVGLAADAATGAADAAPSLGVLFWQQVGPQLLELAGAVLVVVLAIWKLKAPQWVQAATDNQLLQSALIYASDLVRAFVTKAQATTVADLKAALADGTITKHEYQATLAKLKQTMLNELLAQTLGRLRAAGLTGMDAQNLLDAKIEEQIPSAKALVASAHLPLFMSAAAASSVTTSAGPQSPAS